MKIQAPLSLFWLLLLTVILLYRGNPLDVRTSPEVVVIKGRQISLETRHTELARPFLHR